RARILGHVADPQRLASFPHRPRQAFARPVGLRSRLGEKPLDAGAGHAPPRDETQHASLLIGGKVSAAFEVLRLADRADHRLYARYGVVRLSKTAGHGMLQAPQLFLALALRDVVADAV